RKAHPQVLDTVSHHGASALCHRWGPTLLLVARWLSSAGGHGAALVHATFGQDRRAYPLPPLSSHHRRQHVAQRHRHSHTAEAHGPCIDSDPHTLSEPRDR